MASGKLKVELGGESNYVRQTYYCGFGVQIYTRVRYWANSAWQWAQWHEVTNIELNSKISITNLGGSEGIKTVALNDTRCPVNQVRWFNLRNSDTSELPGDGQKYSVARVTKRTSGTCHIEVFTDGGDIWVCGNTGANWTSWEMLALNSNLDKLQAPESTGDILSSATSVTKTTIFKGNGSSYTGTLPSAIYRYGVFIVTPRDGNRIVQAVADGAYAVNYYNGSTWNGWQEFALNSATPHITRTNSAFTFSTTAVTQTIQDSGWKNKHLLAAYTNNGQLSILGDSHVSSYTFNTTTGTFEITRTGAGAWSGQTVDLVFIG